MLRRSFRCWLIVLLLGPTCALALEIGEIQINSALNQLFDARIPLPNLTPEELAKVSVKLAPPPMFKEFGLDRARALGKLVFSIEYNAEGEVYVRVVSTEPIREPSLGLLLEFGWPRGKTYREFTVFLDPVQRLAKRPSDRTKTVLDKPEVAAVAGAGSASPPPAPESAPEGLALPKPEPEPSPKPEPVVTVAVSESTAGAVEPPPLPVALPPLPVETPPLPAETPATIKTYKPGDHYGPVALGEGLWRIALKLRPDGITREEMMQALFRANPQAFGKAGIEGLKIGSTLRIPTLREIANFTGSKVARQLAETEQASLLVATEPTGATPARSGGSGPEVFALAPPPVFEPTPIAVTPAVVVGESAPAVFEAGAQPIAAVQVAPAILEPISATPLLFLAVSEVIASAVQVPVLATSTQIAPVSSIPAIPLSEPAPQAPDTVAIPPVFTTRPVADSARPPGQIATDVRGPVMLKPPVVGTDAIEWLAALEQRIPPVMLDLTSPSLRSDVASTPLPAMELERVSSPTMESGGESEPLSAETLSDTATPPVVEMPSETVAPPVAETSSEATEAAVSETAKSPATQTAGSSTYKGGDQYGPVAPNERLWDIAAKVRPHSAIGKDVMMKALFKANPQAFSKARIDQIKEGALLRIPTLREIVEYTGSKAARELLEQQQTVEAPAPDPAVSLATPTTAPAPAASPSPEPAPVSETPPVPEPAPVSETPPIPESVPVSEAPPIPESAAPSVPAAEILPAPSPEPAVESPPALEPVAPTTETPAITDSPLSAPAGGKEVSK